eukprot:Opistho-1_new@35623
MAEEGLAELALGLHIDSDPPRANAQGSASANANATRVSPPAPSLAASLAAQSPIAACLPLVWASGHDGGDGVVNDVDDQHHAQAGLPASPRGGRGEGSAWTTVGPQALPVFDDAGVTPQSISDLVNSPDVMEARRQFGQSLARHTCYDLLPDSGKIVVFDTALLVKKAFFALVQNGIRSAPLWDSRLRRFVGMITITDFINILRKYYRSPLVTMDELEEHKIQTWRVMCAAPDSIVSIDPSATLREAVRVLVESKIHRLPLIDASTGSAVAILTHKRVLGMLHAELMGTSPEAFKRHSIFELGIGTYRNIATASPDMPLIIVLNVFHERRVSAVPIVDESGVVVDVYAKFDVMNLARERAYNNLDVSVKEALLHRREYSQAAEGLHTCLKTDNLMTIIDRIVKAKVHRLIVVDSTNRVVGIVSLSDILSFFLVD